jgi:hypothetical protein
MKKSISTTLMIAVFTTLAFSQNHAKTARGTIKETVPNYKFSVSTTWLTFDNFGPEETNATCYFI